MAIWSSETLIREIYLQLGAISRRLPVLVPSILLQSVIIDSIINEN